MVRRSTRSRSRGRTEFYQPGEADTKPAPVKKEVKPPPIQKPKMQFAEGEEVMARWPGSSLFFKAKVILVREEQNEYDVEYENGTVYTNKAKDVHSASKIIKKTKAPRRSKSKTRSTRGRKAAPAEPVLEPESPVEPETEEETEDEKEPEEKAEPEEEKKPEEEKLPEDQADPVPDEEPKSAKVVEKIKKVIKSVKAETPTRVSARLAAKAISDAFSDDEDAGKVKLAPNPELPDARGKKKSWSFEWVWALIFMVLGPLIIITLHTLCSKNGCKLDTPKISLEVEDYVDKEAMLMLVGFGAILKILAFLPVGATVSGRRMNGFLSLLVLLSAVPALVYHKVPLTLVAERYFQLMSGCILISFVGAIAYYILSRWAPKSAINPKGNTGNPIVDIFNGRTTSPIVLGFDVKLQTFRFSMIGLAVLNVLMVSESIVAKGGNASPTVILAAAFQVLYAMDAMFFEEYYFHSHDAMNSGFGFSLISSYMTFPFLPTLITKYLLERSPVVAWYYLSLIGLMNGVGYVVFRSSETQRCEFAKDPSNPALAHLETVSTASNRKLIVSGWWGLVRHPNYLGELLIQWSWVLPAVGALGVTDLVPYYLPVVTTLMLIIRCHQINQRNKKKYGSAWNAYTENVRSNMIPKVY